MKKLDFKNVTMEMLPFNDIVLKKLVVLRVVKCSSQPRKSPGGGACNFYLSVDSP